MLVGLGGGPKKIEPSTEELSRGPNGAASIEPVWETSVGRYTDARGSCIAKSASRAQLDASKRADCVFIWSEQRLVLASRVNVGYFFASSLADDFRDFVCGGELQQLQAPGATYTLTYCARSRTGAAHTVHLHCVWRIAYCAQSWHFASTLR